MFQKTECIIDANLVLDLDNLNKANNVDSMLKRLAGADCAVSESDLASTATATHTNGFADLLKICWATHAGVVLRPSFLMFVVMSQVAQHIKANAEAYRKSFTGSSGSSGKTSLTFVGYTLDSLTMDILLSALAKELESIGIDTALFCPQFSDSTARTIEATTACFCEAMGAYFDYIIAKCGLSKVCIVGTADDWEKAALTCEKIGLVLSKNISKAGAEGNNKLQEVACVFRMIWAKREDASALRQLIRVEQCQSGSDTLVGHLVTLYNLTAQVGKSNDGLPSALITEMRDCASVMIEDEINDAVWRKVYGIMSSQIDAAGYLEPTINRIVLREHAPLSVKREAQKRLGATANLDSDAEYKKAKQAGKQADEAAKAAAESAQAINRYVFVSNIPQIRDAMAAGIGTILVGVDDGFVNLVAGATVAGGPNKKTLEQLHDRYVVTVSASGCACTCTSRLLPPPPAESPEYVFTLHDILSLMRYGSSCFDVKNNPALIKLITNSHNGDNRTTNIDEFRDKYEVERNNGVDATFVKRAINSSD